MDKLCLSVLNYYKSQIVSLWSIYLTKEYTPGLSTAYPILNDSSIDNKAGSIVHD
jgi:hypothetical protein